MIFSHSDKHTDETLNSLCNNTISTEIYRVQRGTECRNHATVSGIDLVGGGSRLIDGTIPALAI
jgi:hypothetical protein